ncbi:MAG: hypothetical protein AB1758_28110, partial [Candidatus Eremiobacterota bacterium]
MNLRIGWMNLSGAIPPGRYQPDTGEHLHYLEVRDGRLESQERHGSVLVRQDRLGQWKPVKPRDGAALTHRNAHLGFWKGSSDGPAPADEVVTFEEAYPDRPRWTLNLQADHALLTFHSGPAPSRPAAAPPGTGRVRKKRAPIHFRTDPLSLLSTRFVGLLERRIPTSFPVPDENRRKKILDALEPGDVILETNLAYPGWKQLVYFTLDSNYTHAALYEGEGKFLEATPHGGVQRSDLEKYFNDTVKLAILKMPYATQQDRQAAIDNFRSIRGMPYNRTANFLTTARPRAFGCTEAVTWCLENLPNPIRVPRASFSTGHETVSPAAFFQIPGVEVKYDDQADYYADQKHSWPVGAVGVGAGVVSDMVALALGAS